MPRRLGSCLDGNPKTDQIHSNYLGAFKRTFLAHSERHFNKRARGVGTSKPPIISFEVDAGELFFISPSPSSRSSSQCFLCANRVPFFVVNFCATNCGMPLAKSGSESERKKRLFSSTFFFSCSVLRLCRCCSSSRIL